jgi:hypothetical protein
MILAPLDDARGATRRVVDFSAFVRESDAVALRLRVKDISTDGCRLWGSEDLKPQSEIWLKIAGLAPLRARVAWVTTDEAGCEFTTPLHAATVEQLLAPTRRITKGVFGAIQPKN